MAMKIDAGNGDADDMIMLMMNAGYRDVDEGHVNFWFIEAPEQIESFVARYSRETGEEMMRCVMWSIAHTLEPPCAPLCGRVHGLAQMT